MAATYRDDTTVRPVPPVVPFVLLMLAAPSAAQECHISSLCSAGQFCDPGLDNSTQVPWCEDTGGATVCDGYGLGETSHGQCDTDSKLVVCEKSCGECSAPPPPVVCADAALCGLLTVVCDDATFSACQATCTNWCIPNSQPPGQCADCPAGRFIDAGAVDPLAMQCEACPAGQFGSSVGQTSCASCADGSQTSVAGLTECGPCPLGSVPNIARDGCDACPGGQYSTDGVSCEACPAGQIIDSASSGAATVADACDECPAGEYSESTGSTDCIECPVNKAASAAAQTDWNARNSESAACAVYNDCCSAGDDETSCGCLVGQYCHVDATCADGTADLLATECQSYAPGGLDHHFCSSDCRAPEGTIDNCNEINGTRLDVLCPLSCGTCPRPGRVDTASCSACPLGKHHPPNDAADHTSATLFGFNGDPGCMVCPSGKFADETGLGYCKVCPVGKYVDVSSLGAEDETAACIQCEIGKWSDNQGSERCETVACDAGSASTPVEDIVVGDGLCTECSPGYFSDTAGQPYCVSASPGTFVASSAATTVDTCDATIGEYQDEHHATVCKSCPLGTIALLAATGCATCPAGTYGPDGLVCTDCTPGRYKLASTCTDSDCPSNSDCDPAPAGTFVEATAWDREPLACPAGTYAAIEEQTACIACGAGTRPNAASDGCDNCPVGRYGIDGIACEVCPSGRYSDKTDGTSITSSCQQCLDGHEPTNAAPATCVETAASPSVATDATACSQVVGSDLETASTCEAVMTEADATVAACTYTPAATVGFTACAQCEAGQVSTGGRQCQLCPPDQISASDGSATCQTCNPGEEPTGTVPATSCSPCDVGTASPNGLSCLACTDGRKAPGSSAAACDACPAGQESSDSITCSPCPEGSHKPVNEGLCLLCPAGQYQPAVGMADCIAADAGHFVALPGATAQVACAQGLHQSSTSQDACQPCGLGSQPTTAKDGCEACDAGKATLWREDLCASFNGVPSLTVPDICCSAECGENCGNEPEHCAGDSAGSCCGTVILAANEPCVNTNMAGAAPCVLSDAQQPHECEDCRPGFYEPDTGSTQCDPAPLGYRVAGSGATEITSCSAGQVQPRTGQAACESCPAGHEANTDDTLDETRCQDNGCSITVIVHAPADATSASEIGWSIPQRYPMEDTNGPSYSAGAIEEQQVPLTSGTHTLSLWESMYYDGWGTLSDGTGASIELCNGPAVTNPSGKLTCADAERLIRIDDVPPVCNTVGSTPDLCTEYVNYGQPNNGAACRSAAKFVWRPSCNTVPEEHSFLLECPLEDGCKPQRSCRPCPAGKARAADSADGCVACLPGTFATEGATSCVLASKGFYVPGTEAASQTACEAGTYQDQVGQSECKTCPTERNIGCIPTHTDACAAVGIEGVNAGDDCNANQKCTYNDGATPGDTSDDSCETTTAGTTCDAEADNGEVACNGAGFVAGDCTYTGVPTSFRPTTDAVTCEMCPAGQYFATATTQSPYNHCQQCSPGQYQSTAGAMLCEDAPAGSIAQGSGSTTAERCSGIYAQPVPGQAECATCADLGALNSEPTPDHVNCEACAPGRYSAGTVCVDCEPGQYQPAQGASECIDAEAGSYVPRSGSSAQTQCSLGHFQRSTGASQCDRCGPGQVANTEYTDCDRCPGGTFATASMVECRPCTTGTWALSGSSECGTCGDGSETLSSQQTACTPCPAGQDGNGARCADCRVGYYAPTEQTPACIPAPIGYYVNESRSATFLECGEGTVATEPGLAECEVCANGFGVREKEIGCEPCPAQFFGRAGVCNPCPEGFTQVERGSSSCVAVSFDTQPLIGGALFTVLLLLVAMRVWGLCCCAEGGLCGEPAEGNDLHVKHHPGGLKVTKHLHHSEKKKRLHKHKKKDLEDNKDKDKQSGKDIEDPEQLKEPKHEHTHGHKHEHKHEHKHKSEHEGEQSGANVEDSGHKDGHKHHSNQP